MSHFDDEIDRLIALEATEEEFIHDCYENDIWITKDFETIPIQQLSPSHLNNIINYIHKGGEVYALTDEWLTKLEKEAERRKNELLD